MRHLQPICSLLAVLSIALGTSACTAAPGRSASQKRAAIQRMHDDTLDRLEQKRPGTRQALTEAAGYGVFANKTATALFVGGGGGYGVVHENGSGETTYMRLTSFGVGLGLGGRDVRYLIVFPDYDVLREFVDDGWSFEGDLDATFARDSDDRDTARIGSDRVTIFRVTELGYEFAATLKGTRFTRDVALNAGRER